MQNTNAFMWCECGSACACACASGLAAAHLCHTCLYWTHDVEDSMRSKGLDGVKEVGKKMERERRCERGGEKNGEGAELWH